MNVAWVEGRTAPKRFTLKINGAAVDLTARTLSLILRDASGTLIASPGTVTAVSPQSGDTLGQCDYTPASASIMTAAVGTYRAHIKDVDGDGRIRFFPEAGSSPDPIVFTVGRAGG
jgi:hypothetical protein